MNSGMNARTLQVDEWETPPEIFEPLDREFRFTLDAAASKETAKCGRFFTKEEDGLKQDWSGHTVWVNPPYSRGQIKLWTSKALIQCSDSRDVMVVMLLPTFTDQRWFHAHVDPWAELRFFEGRIRFLLNGERQGSPRFPSMLAIWRGR